MRTFIGLRNWFTLAAIQVASFFTDYLPILDHDSKIHLGGVLQGSTLATLGLFTFLEVGHKVGAVHFQTVMVLDADELEVGTRTELVIASPETPFELQGRTP